MILDEIVAYKRKELEERKIRFSMKKLMQGIERHEATVRRRDFKRVLKAKGINIIAEVKKASPSKGILCENFDPCRLAHLYEFSDCAAISVLTEQHFFKGRLSFLRTIREVTARPLLRKDFIIDPYQIYETAYMAADAVLLIASILSVEEMTRYISMLGTYDIAALVEVHTVDELKRAVDAGATIIGINNRDLYTFNVDLKTTEQICRYIPKGTVVVSESGIRTFEDIQRLKSIGVNAFLIGETLVRSENIVQTMRSLRGERCS